MTQDEVKQVLREEMDARGWHNDDWRAGLAAIIGGESNFQPRWETGYSHTSNDRIRAIFPSRTADLSDAQLNAIKASDATWFNFIYGPQTSVGRALGNIDPSDGYRFRGGGLIQLTGRFNYARYGRLAGADLVTDPNRMVLDPRVAAAVAVEFMKDNFRGGDFEDMKKAVGVSIGKPDELKNQLYAQYVRTKEWLYNVSSREETPVVVRSDPIVMAFLDAAANVQKFLKAQGLYKGPIDGDFGPGTRAALKAYEAQAG